MRSASSWKITIRLFFDLCKVPVSQAHNGLSARAGPAARSPVGRGRASLGGPRLSGRQIAGIPTSTAGPRTPGQAKDSLTITGGLGLVKRTTEEPSRSCHGEGHVRRVLVRL